MGASVHRPNQRLVNHNHHGYSAPMKRLLSPLPLCLLTLCALAVLPACAVKADDRQPTIDAPGIAAPGIAAPAVATPIMKLDDVRIGMKGYGLTVFHGDKIEPFAVEVVSVQRDFAPAKGVIWIRCPEERMQKSGPVQGMSGSPIYLWEQGAEANGELGKGGRLIGAFAFGFEATKDCYVGVQPIEQMLRVGQNAQEQLRQEKEKNGEKKVDREGVVKAQKQAAGGDGQAMREGLRTLLQQSEKEGKVDGRAWRGRLIAQAILGGADVDERLSGVDAPGRGSGRAFVGGIAGDDVPPPPVSLQSNGQAMRMMLPMTVSSPGLAQLIAPLVKHAGLLPMQAPLGAQAGRPPVEITAGDIRLSPGSILSIPLAYGDLDLSAVGTVTDVLPDGRVLAFGHAMFGQGPLAVPMATGYVHYIVPGLITSFKLAGSGVIRGTVVRDEASGIVGAPVTDFTTAKASLRITHVGQKPHEYHYDMVQYKPLLPTITAIVAIESLNAQQMLPTENTVRIRGTMKFAGGREISIDSIVPGMEDRSLYYELLPPVMVMAENEHESVMLESIDLNIEIENKLKMASFTTGRLDKATVAPGQDVGINVTLQPYGGESFIKRIKFQVPQDLPDGDYKLMVCDAATYAQVMLSSRPHLLQTRSVDDIFSLLKRVAAVPNDALFVMLQLPDAGIAVGQREFPKLPSSMRGMIDSPTSATVTSYATYATKTVKMETVPNGQVDFTITVRRDPNAKAKLQP